MSSQGYLELVRLSQSRDHLEINKQLEKAEPWIGIAFQFEQHNFVIPVGDVLEVINLPELTPIPFSQSWILGVANWRGKLLTVVDLKQRNLGLFTELKNSKLLCLSNQDHYLALLLDHVDGIKHFDINSYCAVLGNLESTLQSSSRGFFYSENQKWYVLDVSQLLTNTKSNKSIQP